MTPIQKFNAILFYYDESRNYDTIQGALSCMTSIHGMNDKTIDDVCYWLHAMDFEQFYNEYIKNMED